MLFLYLLFYKTSWSVSASYQPLVTVSLVQWGALLWQVWFWVQGHVGIQASGAPNIGCASTAALIQGLEERGYFMIILFQRGWVVWALRSSIAVVHIGEDRRFSVAEAVGVHRSSEAFVGSSWWKLLGFSCTSFLPWSELRSERSCWAEGWSDSGKILPSLSYVAFFFLEFH